MKVEFFNWDVLSKTLPKTSLSKKILTNLLKNYFSEYNISSMSIIFTDQGYIKDLNSRYRKKDSVTDVLSFTIDTEPLVGELYICPEFIKKHTESLKYQEEILRNIIHGFLHILGYDHKANFTEETYNKEKMFVKQENILQNILNEINNRTGESR